MASTVDSASTPDQQLKLRDPANRVAPNARRYWLARAAVRAGVLLAVQVGWLVHSADGAKTADAWHVPLLVVTALMSALYAGLMPVWRYRVHRWEVTTLAVYTQTGWLRRERRIAPLSRVQTVDTEQGAIARLLGLAKVTVTTASAAGPLVIDGLASDVAADLVEQLTAAAAAERSDAT
jgi:membrane protein YdbS with pleckstrin-like domain